MYNDDDLKMLDGSDMKDILGDRIHAAFIEFQQISRQLKLSNKFTFNDYIRAISIVESRGHFLPDSNMQSFVMIPLADMCNHQFPADTQCLWTDEGGVFVVRALRDIDEDDEICISYCEQTSNIDTFYQYGFVT